MLSKVNQAEYMINDSIETLNDVVSDWSIWDDTLEFVNNNNNKYKESNLNNYTFRNLKINVIFMLDRNNEIKYSNFYDIDSDTNIKMPDELLNYINNKKSILCSHKDVNSIISGVISVDGKPMMFSSRPITDSNLKSGVRGTLIMCKYIDYGLINKIQNILDSKLKIKKIINKELEGLDKDITIRINGKGVITSYSFLKGLEKEPLFIVQIDSNRNAYNQAYKSVYFYILLLIGSVCILFFISTTLLKIFIVKPIEDMSNEVTKIKLGSSNGYQVRVKGKDEISRLATAINNMLNKIQLNNKKIQDSEYQLKLVLEGSNAGYWDWNIEKNILKVSDKFLSILGYSVGELPESNDIWEKLIHKHDFQYSISLFNNNFMENTQSNIIEHRMKCKSGEYKWILNQYSTVEFGKDGNRKRMTGIITDISYKKKCEEQLKYLTYYDNLTGVFNRGYYEFIIEKLNNNNKLPFSVIMGDLNGLKIANDTFGHEQGDMLLSKAAEILQQVCGANAIVSRYGGDEFIIILQNTDEKQADNVCVKIKERCLNEKVGHIQISIALGCATKIHESQNIDEIVKEAEEKMYRNKLLEDKSARNGIVSSLSKTLGEKSNETEEHTKRIYSLCVKISKILSLSGDKMDELYLLAKLHDIGKIAIDDKILNKPEKLTDEEWKIMKTHCEIGYRVAACTPDLIHVAYGILTHHERYDGKGYPNGLEGEQIPLLSRLLSIVDAFDVMTHERPYKKAISNEEAIAELKRCAGEQFDPKLVDVCIKVFKEIHD